MGSFIRSWNWGKEYFRHVRPNVIRGLAPIRQRAEEIPHPDLRDQALSSLNTKQFHCEGGGVFAGPSRDISGHLLQFLLPYQTLCDYLDTVTDRGPSQELANLRQLHQSLLDAVALDTPLGNYYALHPYGDDGGYIHYLIEESRRGLQSFPGHEEITPSLERLIHLYIDLQVYKHGPVAERVPRLSQWHRENDPTEGALQWWEFSAAAGTTLGLFALLTVAQDPHPSKDLISQVTDLYLPWIGALHILLDYYVDEEEDRAGGDLNFVTYYPSREAAISRIQWIYQTALQKANALPDRDFHHYVAKGLLGFYLSDQKVRPHFRGPTCKLLATGGTISMGVYLAALVGRSP